MKRHGAASRRSEIQAPALTGRVGRFTYARSASRICKDPFENPYETGKRCPHWLEPLTDPGLVVLDDIKYLARLIQLRDTLREARNVMLRERFDALYQAQLRIVEDMILPRFTGDRLREAGRAAKRLPPLPDLTHE